MKKIVTAFGAMALLLILTQCNQQNAGEGKTAEPDLSADKAALAKADSGWSAATGAKDPAAFSSFLADDVVGMAPNAPVQNGKNAFTNLMKGFFAIPGFYVKWQPTKVEIVKAEKLVIPMVHIASTLMIVPAKKLLIKESMLRFGKNKQTAPGK